MWGGRTPIGIDCSGYTQMVYRFFNIQLPRDAWQQAKQGKSEAPKGNKKGSSKKEEKVVDAEFEEVDDNKKE